MSACLTKELTESRRSGQMAVRRRSDFHSRGTIESATTYRFNDLFGIPVGLPIAATIPSNSERPTTNRLLIFIFPFRPAVLTATTLVSAHPKMPTIPFPFLSKYRDRVSHQHRYAKRDPGTSLTQHTA